MLHRLAHTLQCPRPTTHLPPLSSSLQSRADHHRLHLRPSGALRVLTWAWRRRAGPGTDRLLRGPGRRRERLCPSSTPWRATGPGWEGTGSVVEGREGRIEKVWARSRSWDHFYLRCLSDGRFVGCHSRLVRSPSAQATLSSPETLHSFLRPHTGLDVFPNFGFSLDAIVWRRLPQANSHSGVSLSVMKTYNTPPLYLLRAWQLG